MQMLLWRLRPHRSRLLVVAALVLAAALPPAVTQATTVVEVTDQDLVTTASAIVVGHVTGIESRWEAARQRIFTHVTVAVQEVLKGEVTADELTVKQLGGEVQGVRHWVQGSPEFKRGERVLLFLRQQADGSLRVLHLYQGKFSITTDPSTGEAHATRRAGAGVNVLGSPGAGAGARTPGPDVRKLEELKTLIRSLVKGGRRSGAAPGPVAGPRAAATSEPTQSLEEFIFLSTPSRWFEPDGGTPVTMYINSAGEPAAPGGGFDQVRAGLSAWSDVTGSSFRYRDGGLTGAAGFRYDGVNAISFRDPDGEMDPPSGCAGTLAIGGYWRGSATRAVSGQTFYQIVEGDIIFADGWQGCGFYESYSNLAEVATHELGHALGLGHSPDGDATMYAYAHFDGRGASLRSDDVAGARFMYPAATATLSVVKAGTGSGTVTSSPTGITCGSDCSEAYNVGTAVTLAASAASGSTFAGWSGACSGTGSCAVTVNGSMSVTATFQAAPTPPPLTASFTSPAAGATVSATVTVGMAASGASGTSNTFTLTVDGVVKSTQTVSGTSASYAWDTRTASNGAHTLGLTVRDGAGRTATASRTVTVSNTTVTPPPPTGSLPVGFSSPAAGATVRGTQTVSVWVSGASGLRTFTLSVNGTVVATKSLWGSVASLSWDTTKTPDGLQTMVAAVRDGAGKAGTASRNVTVSNGTTPPPPSGLTVSFTSPAAGATVSGTLSVGMAASGASGTSNTFTLAVDGVVKSTQTVSGTTASYAWDTRTATNAVHTLTLTVRDATGKVATATRSMTVSNTTSTPPPSGSLPAGFSSPAAGATVGGTVSVSVWVSGASGLRTFTLTANGSVVGTKSVWGSTATFSWNTTSAANGAATLTVTIKDGTGKTGTASRSVTVRN